MDKSIPDGNTLKRKIGIVTFLIFVLSLIPLLLISRYDHSSVDDYAFGFLTAQTWMKTHSFIQTLYSACRQVDVTYFGWQGTFSGLFLNALQPAIFGENFYMWTPIILLFSFVIGTLMLLKVFLLDYMKTDKYNFIIISLLILILSIQFMYSPVEGFYWYSGGILYTFFYSLTLILFSLVLLYLKSDNPFAKIFYAAFSSILGFLIGGGNYTTALTTVIILFFIMAYHAIQKNRHAIMLSAIFTFSLAGLIISVTAPGNAIRQASVGHPNAIKAIILSFVYGAYSVCNSTTVPVVIAWLFLIPFIYRIVRDSEISFKHPLIFSVLSFCIYCSQVTPPFYALGLSLPERLINIVYYSYCILVLMNLFYFLGWISKKIEGQIFCNKPNWKNVIQDMLSIGRRYAGQISIVMAVLFFCTSIGLCTVAKGTDGKPQFSGLPTSVSAVQSLLNGDAKTYDTEANQRILAYQDTSQKTVQVKDYSVKPYLLCENDIVEDGSDWRNQLVAKFYGKESVQLKLSNR
jgi:hypothetical protein